MNTFNVPTFSHFILCIYINALFSMIIFLKLMMHFNKQQGINEQVTTLLCSVCTVVMFKYNLKDF